MSYFLAEKPLFEGTTYILSKDEARHIALSRRIKIGQTIALQDPNGKRFSCVVTHVDKSSVTVSIEHQLTVPIESKLTITIFQALISENALDNSIQKITELGATNLVIFPSNHSPNSVEEKIGKKLDRWHKISIEAAKQSDRIKPLTISYFSGLPEVASHAKPIKLKFLLDPESKDSMTSVLTKNMGVTSIGIFIGPEGGFSTEEAQVLSHDIKTTRVRVGPRMLRADTAAISATALAQAMLGDMA